MNKNKKWKIICYLLALLALIGCITLFFQKGIVVGGVFMRQTINQEDTWEYAYGMRKITFTREEAMVLVTVSGIGEPETYYIKPGYGGHATIFQENVAIANGTYRLNAKTNLPQTTVHFSDSAYQSRFLTGYRQDFPHKNTGAVHPVTLLTLLHGQPHKRGITPYLLAALAVGLMVWIDMTKRGYLAAASQSADGTSGANSRFIEDVMNFSHMGVTRGGGLYVPPAAMNYLSKTKAPGEFASVFNDIPGQKPNRIGKNISWIVFGLLALWLLAKALRLL